MNAASTESARENKSRPSGWKGEMVHAAFQKAAESRPWTEGYRSMDVDRIACDAVRLSAPLPAGLRGTLFRNGPARHERGGERYGHRWDGDGMLQQFHFTDRGVSHVGQFIHTCRRRPNFDHPCRLNNDQGRKAALSAAVCG